MDNHGYKSIGGLSRSLGQGGFGTRYAYPSDGVLPGDEAESVETLPVDLATNAESLGAHVFRCKTHDEVVKAFEASRTIKKTTVLYVETDRYEDVPGYEAWWDVPVAEVSTMAEVQSARKAWEEKRRQERHYL